MFTRHKGPTSCDTYIFTYIPYPIYQGPAIQQLNLTWNLGFSLLDDDEMKNGEIGVDDATSDTPAVTLSGATRTIAAVLSAEQKADSSVSQDALHHGKACCKDSMGNESTMRDSLEVNLR